MVMVVNTDDGGDCNGLMMVMVVMLMMVMMVMIMAMVIV